MIVYIHISLYSGLLLATYLHLRMVIKSLTYKQRTPCGLGECQKRGRQEALRFSRVSKKGEGEKG